ncbi:unnamed protein product, partial [Aureobasidium pullulans]
MEGLVKSIGGGFKRTISTLIGNDSNTKGDAHESEDTNTHSTHQLSPTSPDSQPRYKRARTQYDTDPRRIASPRHPEERPRARQAHNQPSPHQEPVASPIEYATSTSPGHAPSDSLLVAQKESPEPDNQVLAKEEAFRQQ